MLPHQSSSSLPLSQKSPMASPLDQSNQQQQTWVPYESAKDCSQGFCSIYCPQWCYLIFPPPPPFSFVDPDDADTSSGGTAFSPLVIAIIGILASAFLLVSYYTIISKYCGGFRRRRRRGIGGPISPDDTLADEDAGNQSHRQEAWHVAPSNGLDEALIGKISVYKYRRGEGVVEGTDCSVCLGEFREEESLRLLPKCSHAFHIQCIDTWLRSHSNCPLCRANIVSVNPALPPPPPTRLPPPPPPQVAEEEQNEETIEVVIEDLEAEEADSEKETWEDQVIEAREEDQGLQRQGFGRSSSSVDCSDRGRVSIADVLKESMEDEFMVAKDQGLLVDTGSSSSGRSKNGKGGGRGRSLHCAMSPVAMKRSVAGERHGVNRAGKGRNSVLPI